jgi:hypothetical protein
MKNCDVLRKVPACREYLAKIFKDLTLHKRPIVKERKPNTTRMIFVAGGYFQHSLDILEGYNVVSLYSSVFFKINKYSYRMTKHGQLYQN